MDNCLGGKFMEGLQVVAQRLLEQVPLLDPCGADMSLQQVSSRRGHQSGYLSFLFHVVLRSHIKVYSLVVGTTRDALRRQERDRRGP